MPRSASAPSTRQGSTDPLDPAVIKLVDAVVRAQAPSLRRGLSRIEAAGYVGVSPSLFDLMVQDGRMPGPKLINTRTVWDVSPLTAPSRRCLIEIARIPGTRVGHKGGEHAAPVQIFGRGR